MDGWKRKSVGVRGTACPRPASLPAARMQCCLSPSHTLHSLGVPGGQGRPIDYHAPARGGHGRRQPARRPARSGRAAGLVVRPGGDAVGQAGGDQEQGDRGGLWQGERGGRGEGGRGASVKERGGERRGCNEPTPSLLPPLLSLSTLGTHFRRGRACHGAGHVGQGSDQGDQGEGGSAGGGGGRGRRGRRHGGREESGRVACGRTLGCVEEVDVEGGGAASRRVK